MNWESTFAIAMELKRTYQNVNIEEVTLGQIYKWTIELAEFDDDPQLANDDILRAIYQDWYEELLHKK